MQLVWHARPRLVRVSRKYFIRTYGCQMNEHDSERIAGLLETDGMRPATRVEDADVVVLNTCCVRENADNKLYGALGHLKALKERRPELEIAVAGCLAQKDREAIQGRAGHVDVVFGTHNLHRVTELLERARRAGPVTEICDEAEIDEHRHLPSAAPVRRDLGWAAWVTIQTGCDNRCAFCIVPSVRGSEMSRPFGEVVAEVERLAAEGVSEVTLLGQNVNSYGRDLTARLRDEAPGADRVHLAGHTWARAQRRTARPLFADLLRAVGGVEGIRRVRFTSPHPKDLRADTVSAMAETASVVEHLHLPLQSGSDRVLAAMHRGYTADRFLERLTAARRQIDDLAVSTDIIVAFPGETPADFEDTLEVVAAAEFDSAFTFVYSPRPGTEAARREADFIPRAVAAERMARLRVVVEHSALTRNRLRIGAREEVVVEGPSKKDSRLLGARTRQNKVVHFDADNLGPGTYALVEINDASTHHLSGELVEVLAPPRRRARIAVVPV